MPLESDTPPGALHDWPATAMLTAFRAKTLSPVEVLTSVLAQVDRWEPQLRATYLLRPEAALAQARASEARWMRGEPLGLLDGIPVTIKDNIATLGDPSPLGSTASVLVPAPQNAPPAERLAESGSVFFAKTTMPDFGMLTSSVSSFHALTRNPWDVSKTPGGSSSGAAAAAAAGYGPLHIGTDIGGSLRLPASWCGVYSLKPSLGRLPIDPPYIGRSAGPITRSVADAALVMQLLSQPDGRDAMGLPPADIDWASLHGIGTVTAASAETRGAPSLEQRDANCLHKLRGLRLGLLLDAGCGLPVDPQVLMVITHAATLFEAAGAVIEPVPAFLTADMLLGMDHAWRMRCLVDMAQLHPDQQQRVLPYIAQWANSAKDFDGPHTFRAFHQFHATRVATARACQAFDYVLSPVAPCVAPAAERHMPTDDPLRSMEHIAFTVPFNMSEQPAASIHAGFTAQGLPIGLQIAGRRFDDLGVLQVCRSFELLRGPQRAWPSPAR